MSGRVRRSEGDPESADGQLRSVPFLISSETAKKKPFYRVLKGARTKETETSGRYRSLPVPRKRLAGTALQLIMAEGARSFRVVKSGFSSTVQDLGRFGFVPLTSESRLVIINHH